MSIKVIGAGFGRTGTHSLKLALEQLGFGPCYHMVEVSTHPEHIPVWRAALEGRPVDWDTILGDYRSTVDWPGAAYWRELWAANPDAWILLSTRDPVAWHESVTSTILRLMVGVQRGGAPEAAAAGRAHARDLIVEGIFDGRLGDRDHAIAVYEAHNAAVRAEVPADRLIDYEVGSGWEALCEPLRVAVPDTPCPRTNTRTEYVERLDRIGVERLD